MVGGAEGPERRRSQEANRKKGEPKTASESRSRWVGSETWTGTTLHDRVLKRASAGVTTLERAPYSPRPTRRQPTLRAFI